jgi:hypothetical protein
MSCLKYENVFLNNRFVVVCFLKMKELFVENKLLKEEKRANKEESWSL